MFWSVDRASNNIGYFTVEPPPPSPLVGQAPITDPGKVLCVGMNYVDHCLEQGMPIPKVCQGEGLGTLGFVSLDCVAYARGGP